MAGVTVDTEIQSPSQALAEALNSLTIGGFGDRNIAFSGAKQTNTHDEMQGSNSAGKQSVWLYCALACAAGYFLYGAVRGIKA